MSSNPAVSVALITYNEEKYVRDAITSVLRQTFSDLELVIVDNGSTDGTAQAIASFADPRIVSLREEKNQGAAVALNRAIAACRGRYLAILVGDDVCHADRLEAQLEAHRRAGGGVIFSNVDYIDDAGHPIESGHFAKDFFALSSLSRSQMLEKFFRDGNFIHPVTCFAEAETLRSAGPFDPFLWQLGDYDWMIRLLKKHTFTILPRCTISARTRVGNANMSAFSPQKQVRTLNELNLVLPRFFDDLSPDLFRAAFREQFVHPSSCSDVELSCEQAFLFLRHPHFPVARLIGVEKLHALLHDPQAAAVLRDQFQVTSTSFAELLTQIDTFNQLPRYETCVFVDTGKDFNAAECCKSSGNHACETFALTYDLSAFTTVRGLRWDPAELQLCRVRLEAVSWRDRNGGLHEVDLGTIWSNGRLEADGTFTFQTLDPMIFLPIVGDVSQLTLCGRWQVTEPAASAMQSNALLLAREEEFRRREVEFQEREKERDEELRVPRASRGLRWWSAVGSLFSGGKQRRVG